MPYLLLRFYFLGSVVGGGVFVVARDLLDSFGSVEIVKTLLTFVLGVPLWGILGSFISIPLGFVPATVASLTYRYMLRRHTVENPSALVRAAIGAAAGGVAAVSFGGALFLSGSGPGGYSVMVNALSWLIAGFFGGTVSALSAGKRTYKTAILSRSATAAA